MEEGEQYPLSFIHPGYKAMVSSTSPAYSTEASLLPPMRPSPLMCQGSPRRNREQRQKKRKAGLSMKDFASLCLFSHRSSKNMQRREIG